MCLCNCDLCHWPNLSRKQTNFQKKARSKKFPYSSERPRGTISKSNYVKRIPLLSKKLKLNYPRNKGIPYKCCLFWKTQPKLFEICTNWICVIALIFSENKKRFQKKPRPKEFSYSSEKLRTAISKPNYVKGIPLLSGNLKLNYPRNKLIPYKCPILWNT